MLSLETALNKNLAKEYLGEVTTDHKFSKQKGKVDSILPPSWA